MTTDRLWPETAEEGVPSLPPARPKPRRWPYALIALFIVLAGGAYAWLGRVPATDGVLHVGSQRGGTKSLMIASGALKGAPYQVEWSEFPAAQNLQEAIGAGAVDIGVAGDAPFQFAYQSGQPIKAVAALAMRPRPPGVLAILVPKNSLVRDAAGLRGKKIATTRGSVGHYLILRVLEAKGLTPEDVKITFLSPGDTKAAFDSGAIDAWATWTPYVPTALAGGARIVADGADYFSGYSFDVANARSVETKRALIADFLRREAKAYDWARTHPDDHARVLAKETGLPLEIALYQVQHQRPIRVPIDGAVKADEEEVVGHFRKAGALAGKRPLDQAYEPLDQNSPHGR